MNHSPKFEKVKKYYDTLKPDGTHMWNIDMVRNSVVKNWITAEEFNEITGEPFEG